MMKMKFTKRITEASLICEARDGMREMQWDGSLKTLLEESPESTVIGLNKLLRVIV